MPQSLQRSPERGLVALLWAVVLLFAARVAAQALQLWAPVSFLPPFGAFQGSTLPYGMLLGAQLTLLIWMIYLAFGVQHAQTKRRHALGVALLWFGSGYLAFSLLRLAIGVGDFSDYSWFDARIPIAFHCVLSVFCLTLSRYHIVGERTNVRLTVSSQ